MYVSPVGVVKINCLSGSKARFITGLSEGEKAHRYCGWILIIN